MKQAFAGVPIWIQLFRNSEGPFLFPSRTVRKNPELKPRFPRQVSGFAVHVPKLVRPVKSRNASTIHAASKGIYAEAWQFLKPRHGRVRDLQGLYESAEVDAAFLYQMVGQLLRLLRHAWYDQAKPGACEELWGAREIPSPALDSFPPYGFTLSWKARILSSLEELHSRARRLRPADWPKESKLISVWVANGPNTGGRASHPCRVCLSQIHGDLNKNNILFWVEENQAFLIDFVMYQAAAHTLQDFGRLEAEVKFALMETEENLKSPVADYEPSGLPEWIDAERHLAVTTWSPTTIIPPVASGSHGARSRALDVVKLVRHHAFEVRSNALNDGDIEGFRTEYGAALLYPTLRAIAFDTVSLPKRIFAVHSAAQLIDFLHH